MTARFLLLLFTAALATQQAAAAEPRNPNWAQPVRADMNLHQVTPNFFRGEQFTADEVPRLQKLGIKTVINLRGFHSDEKLLKNTGIKIARVKMEAHDIDDHEVIAALAAIRRAEREGPFLLHCQHGADRTGLIVATYRILYENWTRESAIDELRNGGYGFHEIWKNIPRYLEKFDTAKIKSAVEKQLAADK